jgi:hypothetical protein
MAIKYPVLVKSLADDTTDEFEEHQMLLVHSAEAAGMERSFVRSYGSE